MKKLASLLLFMACSTMIGHAQETSDFLTPHQKQNIIVQSNGKYRIFNDNDKPVAVDIDTVQRVRDGFIKVRKGGKVGLLFQNGTPCIPLNYDDIDAYTGTFWIVTKGKYKGIFTYDGKQILPPVYQEITVEWQNNYDKPPHFIVKKEKYGLFDSKGNMVVPTEYTKIEAKDDHWKLTKGYPFEYIFNNGNTVKDATLADEINGISYRKDDDLIVYYTYEKNGLWGLMDGNGHTIITPQYDQQMSLIKYEAENQPIKLLACKDNYYGIIETDNSIVVPFQYKEITRKNYKGLLELETKEGKRLYSLAKKCFLTDFNYEKIENKGHYYILTKDYLKTVFDANTELVLFPFKYTSIDCAYEGDFFIVEKDQQEGVVNSKDEVCIPLDYQYIDPTCNPNLFIIERDNKYGIVNTKNETVYPFSNNNIVNEYDRIEIHDASTDKIIKVLDNNLKEIK